MRTLSYRRVAEKHHSKAVVDRPRALKVVTSKTLASPEKGIHVLVIHEQAVRRNALCKVLKTQPDFVIVGAVACVADAVQALKNSKPDVVLFKPSAGPLEYGEVVQRVRATYTAARTILLTPSLDKSETIKVLQLGARGIVDTNSPARVLHKCIRRVFCGDIWLSRETLSDVVQALCDPKLKSAKAPANYGLTARELETLELVVKGYANKDIARELSIQEDTIKHHLTSIFDKTGMSQRLELAIFALNNHLVEDRSGTLAQIQSSRRLDPDLLPSGHPI